MALVLDTCALLWLTIDPSELSPAAHRAIKNSKRILVSSISIWEIAIKCVKGKLSLGLNIDEYVKRCAQASDFEILPIDHNDWLDSALLKWSHKDPADRIIVSLAIREKADIVTDDKEIKKYYRKSIF